MRRQRQFRGRFGQEPGRAAPLLDWAMEDRDTGAEFDLGERLRTLRIERGLSLRGLAETSGLAANTLSLIENGRTSPSVSTLRQITTALGVDIASLFETPAIRNRVVHVKADHRPSTACAHGLFEDLSAGMRGCAIRPCLVTLDPGSSSGTMPTVHTGYEFVYCMQGRIHYSVDQACYLLEAGDSLLFEAHLPHQWHNADNGVSRALLVLVATDNNDPRQNAISRRAPTGRRADSGGRRRRSRAGS